MDEGVEVQRSEGDTGFMIERTTFSNRCKEFVVFVIFLRQHQVEKKDGIRGASRLRMYFPHLI